jgi:hypothetical protein
MVKFAADDALTALPESLVPGAVPPARKVTAEKLSGGWGREGARSEERAELRLAPGGRAALPLTRITLMAADC